MDQGGDRRRAFHRVRQPGVQAELRRFSHRADEEQDAKRVEDIDRMSREVAVVEKISEPEAVTKIEKTIEASPRRKRAAQAEDEAQDEAA